MADKLFGYVVPVRFALFALIGGFGLCVHMSVLWIGLKLIELTFVAAQTVATTIAMTFNFFLNNLFTYRDLLSWLHHPFQTPPLEPPLQQLLLPMSRLGQHS